MILCCTHISKNSESMDRKKKKSMFAPPLALLMISLPEVQAAMMNYLMPVVCAANRVISSLSLSLGVNGSRYVSGGVLAHTSNI